MLEVHQTNLVEPIIYFGVYDLGKPRNRLMIGALRSIGIDVIEIHANVWMNVKDKTQTSLRTRLILLLRWLSAYPVLIWRYLRAPRHRIVVIGYPGQLDVLVLRPFAWMRNARVALDAFISIYDTVVDDRRLVPADGFVARLLRLWEFLACRAADLVILDTEAHAALFSALYGLEFDRLGAVMVGAEQDTFPRLPEPRRDRDTPLRVLFYGQFIPLHGIRTIVEAARLARDQGERIAWVLIGTGQEAASLRADIDGDPLEHLEWINWVPYDLLRDEIARAHVGLGIFGTSGKAARVIPNKVFQMLSAGRPLVTRDSPAMRELIAPGTPGVRLVPAGDAEALLAAVKDLGGSGETPPPEIASRFSPERLGEDFARLLASMSAR